MPEMRFPIDFASIGSGQLADDDQFPLGDTSETNEGKGIEALVLANELERLQNADVGSVDSGTNSRILSGQNNDNSHAHVTMRGWEGISPSNYTHVLAARGINRQGDAMTFECLFRAMSNSTSTTSLNLQSSATALRFETMQANLGAQLDLAIGGVVEIMGVGRSGATAQKLDRYTINFSAFLTGTQGQSTGWTWAWSDGSTTAASPASFTTGPGTPNIAVTTAPYLNLSASSGLRPRVVANVGTDEVIWLAHMRALFTILN